MTITRTGNRDQPVGRTLVELVLPLVAWEQSVCPRGFTAGANCSRCHEANTTLRLKSPSPPTTHHYHHHHLHTAHHPSRGPPQTFQQHTPGMLRNGSQRYVLLRKCVKGQAIIRGVISLNWRIAEGNEALLFLDSCLIFVIYCFLLYFVLLCFFFPVLIKIIAGSRQCQTIPDKCDTI